MYQHPPVVQHWVPDYEMDPGMANAGPQPGSRFSEAQPLQWGVPGIPVGGRREAPSPVLHRGADGADDADGSGTNGVRGGGGDRTAAAGPPLERDPWESSAAASGRSVGGGVGRGGGDAAGSPATGGPSPGSGARGCSAAGAQRGDGGGGGRAAGMPADCGPEQSSGPRGRTAAAAPGFLGENSGNFAQPLQAELGRESSLGGSGGSILAGAGKRGSDGNSWSWKGNETWTQLHQHVQDVQKERDTHKKEASAWRVFV